MTEGYDSADDSDDESPLPLKSTQDPNGWFSPQKPDQGNQLQDRRNSNSAASTSQPSVPSRNNPLGLKRMSQQQGVFWLLSFPQCPCSYLSYDLHQWLCPTCNTIFLIRHQIAAMIAHSWNLWTPLLYKTSLILVMLHVSYLPCLGPHRQACRLGLWKVATESRVSFCVQPSLLFCHTLEWKRLDRQLIYSGNFKDDLTNLIRQVEVCSFLRERSFCPKSETTIWVQKQETSDWRWL